MSVTKASTNSLTTFAKYNNTLAGQTAPGTLFVAGGNAGTILTSTDGITWTARTSGNASAAYRTMRKRFGYWSAQASLYSGSSTDGTTWTHVDNPLSSSKQIVSNNNHFSASGELGYGTSGTQRTVAGSTVFYATSGSIYAAHTYGAKVIIGVDAHPYTYYSSNGGATWTPASTNLGANCSAFWISSNGLLIASVASGSIRTSTDGATWTNVKTTNSSYLWNELRYANGLYWLGTDSSIGTFYTSTDGTNWNTISVTAGTYYDMTYGNGVWVVVGNGGKILTSTDGTTWTSRTSGTANDLYSIAFG